MNERQKKIRAKKLITPIIDGPAGWFKIAPKIRVHPRNGRPHEAQVLHARSDGHVHVEKDGGKHFRTSIAPNTKVIVISKNSWEIL